MGQSPGNSDRSRTRWKTIQSDLISAGLCLQPVPIREAPALTVAIPFDYAAGWSAQTSFLRSVCIALNRTAHPKSSVLVLNQSAAGEHHPALPDLSDSFLSIPREVWKDQKDRTALLDDLKVDCILNLFGTPPGAVPGLGLVGWIPDFQHFRLPSFFTEKERDSRDRQFREILGNCHRIILSSLDAERDCLRFQPDSATKTRVHPFPSGMAFQNLPDSSGSPVLEKYHLPEKFVLVANQFWAHKCHLTVVDAAKLLAESGVDIPFVLTGLPSDYRDPANTIVSKVLQRISMGGLRDRVIALAQVPYPDLIALLRHAALVLQPSSFEGWSTTVQDAKALGRPVACSSIALHREQAPNAVGFFDHQSPGELAELLRAQWPKLLPGPDPAAESIALDEERDFADQYGRQMWRTCFEAVATARAKAPRL